jgi:hypothetical protein
MATEDLIDSVHITPVLDITLDLAKSLTYASIQLSSRNLVAPWVSIKLLHLLPASIS